MPIPLVIPLMALAATGLAAYALGQSDEKKEPEAKWKWGGPTPGGAEPTQPWTPPPMPPALHEAWEKFKKGEKPAIKVPSELGGLLGFPGHPVPQGGLPEGPEHPFWGNLPIAHRAKVEAICKSGNQEAQRQAAAALEAAGYKVAAETLRKCADIIREKEPHKPPAVAPSLNLPGLIRDLPNVAPGLFGPPPKHPGDAPHPVVPHDTVVAIREGWYPSYLAAYYTGNGARWRELTQLNGISVNAAGLPHPWAVGQEIKIPASWHPNDKPIAPPQSTSHRIPVPVAPVPESGRGRAEPPSGFEPTKPLSGFGKTEPAEPSGFEPTTPGEAPGGGSFSDVIPGLSRDDTASAVSRASSAADSGFEKSNAPGPYIADTLFGGGSPVEATGVEHGQYRTTPGKTEGGFEAAEPPTYLASTSKDDPVEIVPEEVSGDDDDSDDDDSDDDDGGNGGGNGGSGGGSGGGYPQQSPYSAQAASKPSINAAISHGLAGRHVAKKKRSSKKRRRR